MDQAIHSLSQQAPSTFRLRVKDVDFGYRQIAVRDGKGEKDRVTMLPTCVIEPLQKHLTRVKALHEQDLGEGFGRVHLLSRLRENTLMRTES